MTREPAVALTVAGSDSGGGAGLQADLKTWEAQGVFGTSVVTCVTAQNTREVRSIEAVPAERVREQIDAVFDDLPVRAVKTGLLPSAEHVHTVAHALPQGPLVVDPVLVATSGDVLAADGVAAAMTEHLLPRATLVTPNLAEASVLAGRSVTTADEMEAAARVLLERGARAVLVKGGHLDGPATDLLVDADGCTELRRDRVDVGPVHGTGCALSAAIAGGLANGLALPAAVSEAKDLVWRALRDAAALGRGARVLRFHSAH